MYVVKLPYIMMVNIIKMVLRIHINNQPKILDINQNQLKRKLSSIKFDLEISPDLTFSPKTGLKIGISDQVDLALCRTLLTSQSERKFRFHQIWPYREKRSSQSDQKFLKPAIFFFQFVSYYVVLKWREIIFF